MVSASGDWTRETPRVEYPAIRSIYALYGAEDKVANVPVDASHNYNKPSREAMYRFFGKWLLGEGDKWANYAEPAFTLEKEQDLRVFPDKKLPEGLPTGDEIIKSIVKSTNENGKAPCPSGKRTPRLSASARPRCAPSTMIAVESASARVASAR